jgi:acyl dehydratase
MSGNLIHGAEERMNTENATAPCVTTIADAPLHVGQKVGPTEWRRMAQEQVNQFAEVTGDHNFIHVDPERARKTVFGGTIAHGYLTLSLLGPISQQLLIVSDAATSINYGLNKLRFPAPLPVGAEFRGHGEIVDVTPLDKGIQVTATFTIEVKDAARPALVAECLFRYHR